jgi:hypothetical protein
MEILQSKVIADGTIKTQAHAAKMISPLENADRLAVAIYNVDRENKKIREDNFESDLKLKQAQFNETLKNIDNDDNFQTAIDNYNKEIDDLGNSVLGEKEYKKWQSEKGKNYKQLADLGYKSIWLERKQKENYTLLQNVVDKAATEASMIPNQKALVEKNLFNDIDSKTLTPQQKEGLKNRYLAQLAQAEVVRDIRINPDTALSRLNATEEKDGIKEPAFYKGLDSVQRQRYIEAAKHKSDALKNSVNNVSLEPLKNKFVADYTNTKQGAIDWLEDIKNNRLEVMKQLGIDNKQFDTFTKWADGIVKSDDELALEKQMTFDKLEDKYKEFGIYRDNKGKKPTMKMIVGNKQLNNIEDISVMLDEIDTNIANKTFAGSNLKKAIGYQRELYTVLGDMIDNNKIKLKDKNTSVWWGDTVSEDIPKQINAIIDRQFGNVLSTDEKGYLYYRVYANCIANNIDLATKDKSVKDTVKNKIISQLFTDFIRDKYNVPNFNVDGVINNGNLMTVVDTIQRAKQKGATKAVYGNYGVNGNKLELKDKDGNIIDTVEY